MTLDEAIKHAEEVADTCEYEASKYDLSDSYESHVACQEGKCAEEHRRLAEWLKDYKRLKEQQPCGDCIGRQAALDCFTATKLKKFDFILYAREEIKKLPPVNPQPKTGHWIDNHNNTISCDRCHTWFNKDDRYGYMRYCPYCNAKMAESEE